MGSQEDRSRLFSKVLSARTRSTGHNWNRKLHQKPLFYCVGGPERFWSHHSWRYSKPDWTQPFATHSSWPCLSRDWTKGSQESHTHLNNSVKIQLDCPTWKLEWGQLYLSTHWITVNRATVLVLWTHVTVEDLLTIFSLLQAALCVVPGIMRR